MTIKVYSLKGVVVVFMVLKRNLLLVGVLKADIYQGR